MLTTQTKQKINSLRQVLVGKVPDPKSQVEQITNALIYKFMDDMDRRAVKLGGAPTFFVGDYEQYSWRNLMAPRIGAQERMNLYTEGLIKMGRNKDLPKVFREILKEAFVPYRSPETLNLFLQEIDGFTYDHSEELGNAFEYLLSIMGSQGDAGQFRTPRHIIDFIVDVVDPQKGDTILDPACGTAGFLVSAYNHILADHDGKDNVTGKKTDKEQKLSAQELKSLHGHFTGYDISPDMVKLSRVNMFLHQFPEPKIHEYDTISSTVRWNEEYDVILANPPFMSPKGGIAPHGKFSIKATRAEVLFVDYIMEHLRPHGRAGIIVPEGVIFKSGTAYKELRKKLVEDGLFAVVSLPSGVFNPYAGVKTSILLFDTDMGKKQSEICFVKVSADGFDLGAQRRPIDRNDLPEAVEILKAWRKGEKKESAITHWVGRKIIVETGDYNLSGDRYRATTDYSNAKWPMVKLKKLEESEAITLGRGKVISKIIMEEIPGHYPVYSSSAQGDGKFGEYGEYMFDEEMITWSVDGGGRFFYRPRHKFSVTNVSGWLRVNDVRKINTKFLFFVLDSAWQEKTFDYSSKAHPSVIRDVYQIPLPPLEIQKQIVAELDGYQNIINGARQVVDNWKPKIDIDPEWKKVRLGKVVKTITPPHKIQKSEYLVEGNYPIIDQSQDEIAGWTNDENTLVKISKPVVIFGDHTCVSKYSNIRFAQGADGIKILSTDEKLLPEFLYRFLLAFPIKSEGYKRHYGKLTELEIPLPPLAIQKQIVEKIEAECALVESNKKLIEIYEQKMKDVIAKLWQ